MIYLLTIVSIIGFLIMFKRDPRNLYNAFLFFFSIGFFYLSVVSYVYMRLPKVHNMLLDILYIFIPILIVVFGIFMIINGFVILNKEGISLSNSLPLLFGFIIVIYFIGVILYQENIWKHYSNYRLFSIANSIYLIVTFFFILFIIIFFAFLSYSILYLYMPKKRDYDYIIIHGAGLINGEKVSPLLAARIDKAIEVYELREKENAMLIASGGKGTDEQISEAKAIYRYLLEKNIPKEKIILEDKSTNTFENLKFSKEIVEKEMENPKYAFVSNNYHIFRATLYAKKLNMDGQGIGAKTAGYYIPSAFLREYIAIIFRIRWVLLSIAVLYMSIIILSHL